MQRMPIDFRDFAVHMAPGLLYLFAAYEVSQPVQVFVHTNPVVASFVALALGFLVGFANGAVIEPAVRKLVRKVPAFGDPFKARWASMDTSPLFKAARELIARDLPGVDIERENGNRIIYYCLRRIEASDGTIAAQANRIIALDNMALALVPPALCFSFASLYGGLYTLALVSFIAACLLPYGNIKYRDWGFRVIVTGYLAIRMKEQQTGGSAPNA